MKSPRPLVLASTSPYRRALLERFGVPFEVVRPQTAEEHIPGELPRDRAQRLSLSKARAVAARRPEAIVIGSDQVAALDDSVLDKPGDAATCRAQLARLSGGTARFYSGCAVVIADAAVSESYVDLTSVFFRQFTSSEIERYVERERPLDCAGGFKVEALGITLFERIESLDPTALIGLPLIWLAGALRKAGLLLP